MLTSASGASVGMRFGSVAARMSPSAPTTRIASDSSGLFDACVCIGALMISNARHRSSCSSAGNSVLAKVWPSAPELVNRSCLRSA